MKAKLTITELVKSSMETIQNILRNFLRQHDWDLCFGNKKMKSIILIRTCFYNNFAVPKLIGIINNRGSMMDINLDISWPKWIFSLEIIFLFVVFQRFLFLVGESISIHSISQVCWITMAFIAYFTLIGRLNLFSSYLDPINTKEIKLRVLIPSESVNPCRS